MSKSEILKKMLSVVLAAAGFLPVVGASKDSKEIERLNLS